MPSCEIRELFPWRGAGARSTQPPWSAAIAWWPRQTPSSGTPARSAAAIISRVRPARSGRPGPGEITTARGRLATTSSGSNRSLRATSTSGSSLPSAWTRFQVKES